MEKKEKKLLQLPSDLFDSQSHLPLCHLMDSRTCGAPFRSHVNKSVKDRTAPGPDKIRPEYLKILPSVVVNVLARLFLRNLSEYMVLDQWKATTTVLLAVREGRPS